MDPLSVGASIAGLVSLGITVAQALVKFYSECKDQNASCTLKNLERLADMLETLRNELAGRPSLPDEQSLLGNIERHIKDCTGFIHDLQEEYNKLKNNCTGSLSAAARTTARKLAYPFRRSTLQKLDEDVEEIMTHISLALQILQQKDIREVHDDISDIKALLELVRASQVPTVIRDWLKAPDATINYNEACTKRHRDTGLWLVDGPPFQGWLTEPNSFLWLYGFAGCGKSVLCSAAIQRTLRHRRSNSRVGIAFFFFSFSDSGKQDLSGMLRALVLQLSGQLTDKRVLLSLHDTYLNATPPNQALLGCLLQIIRSFDDTYIVLDALDESPRNMYRKDVLTALVELRGWSEPGLHLLVTSRDEPDIHDVIIEELRALPQEIISMKNNAVDADIRSFISDALKSKKSYLCKWEKYHEQIEKTLSEGAQGVFRWVECQLTELSSSAKSKRQLDKLLASLPPSLDATYARMLQNISEHSQEDARRMLTVLCCAKKPLTLPELIESIAVELGDASQLNVDGRLDDENDILRICPGFLEVYHQDIEYFTEYLSLRRKRQTFVRIAHFSIQEYLESDRIRQQAVAMFAVSKPRADAEIASLCLTYLLEPGLIDSGDDYPLAVYATIYWFQHYRTSDHSSYDVNSQAMQLFKDTRGEFGNWESLYSAHCKPPLIVVHEPASPLYYCCLLGLDLLALQLLTHKSSIGSPDKEISHLVSAKGGEYEYALQAASIRGHKEIVQLLLDKGADVNARGGECGNALQAASTSGHKEIVQLLLDKGADVNARGGKYGYALNAAAIMGNIGMVELLLENGADINAQLRPSLDSVLHLAVEEGKTEIAKLLLQKGVKTDARNIDGRTALSQAAWQGELSLVKLLLGSSTVVSSLRDRFHRSPVLYAAQKGRIQVLRFLLGEMKMDPNSQDYCGSAPLSIAVRNNQVASVQVLLSTASINPHLEDNFGRTPMSWAIHMGSQRLVNLLTEIGGVESPQSCSCGSETCGEPESHSYSTGYCDVCMHGFFGDVYYRCKICSRRGEFLMCTDCFNVGAQCLGKGHRLKRKQRR